MKLPISNFCGFEGGIKVQCWAGQPSPQPVSQKKSLLEQWTNSCLKCLWPAAETLQTTLPPQSAVWLQWIIGNKRDCKVTQLSKHSIQQVEKKKIIETLLMFATFYRFYSIYFTHASKPPASNLSLNTTTTGLVQHKGFSPFSFLPLFL